MELLQFAKSFPVRIDAVIIERMDRLARDLMVSELMLLELRKRGLKLFAVDQGELIDMAGDGGDPTRVLIRQIMGALAQWDKANLVKKMSLAKERRRAQGHRCEGCEPFGELPGEKQIWNFIVAMKEQGLGVGAIARQLNEGNFKTRRGTEWTKQAVGYLVSRKEK
jgi:DNA invertase Pin-like site-specific DNA recombinase